MVSKSYFHSEMSLTEWGCIPQPPTLLQLAPSSSTSPALAPLTKKPYRTWLLPFIPLSALIKEVKELKKQLRQQK